HPVAQDAGVVDQHVQVAELVDGPGDERFGALPVGDVVVVGHRPATVGDDLVDYQLGRTVVPAPARLLASEIIHHHAGALGRQQQRFTPADAAPGSRNDCDLAIQCAHD